MKRFFLLPLLFLTGCVAYNIPVKSEVTIGRSGAVEGGRMAVVVQNVVVEDEGGLEVHVGPGEPTAVYRAYILETVPAEIRSQSTIADAFAGDPDDAALLTTDVPADGTVFTFEGQTPEWVLVLKDVTLLRAKYQTGNGFPGTPGQPAMPQGEKRAVRNDVEILLWDNRTGALIAAGEVESEETFTFSPSGGTYKAAVGEFVEKLIANTPMERRQ